MLSLQGYRTVDGVEITDGMLVWDYDLDLSRVSFRDTYVGFHEFDGWFTVFAVGNGERKIMNGERMVTVHPFTRQRADDAV